MNTTPNSSFWSSGGLYACTRRFSLFNPFFSEDEAWVTRSPLSLSLLRRNDPYSYKLWCKLVKIRMHICGLGGRKTFHTPLQAMTLQISETMQIYFLQRSCGQCHIAPNEDVFDHGSKTSMHLSTYANIKLYDVRYLPLKFVPIILGHPVYKIIIFRFGIKWKSFNQI